MPSLLSTLNTLVKDSAVPAEMLNGIVTQLIKADATKSARLLLALSRIQHHDKQATGPDSDTKGPTPEGPFTVDHHRPLALMVYVPRNLKSRLIDDGTGGYGYSHVTIDVGEVDKPTGKPVMTESTTQDVVHRSFQDYYGSRPYVRISLAGLKLDRDEFRKCVNDKLGEPYDDKEALTWGMVDDPAKQICSDMAAGCLPDELRDEIARARQKRKLRKLSVSVHHRFHPKPQVFISPNGFAQFFGAPPGAQVRKPDTEVTPENLPEGVRASGGGGGKGRKAWAVLATVLCAVVIAWVVAEQAQGKRAAAGE